MNSLLRVVLLFAVSAVHGEAQEMPLSHAVTFPAGNAAWSVTFPAGEKSSPQETQGSESAGGGSKKVEGPERFKKIEIVRMGNMRRDRAIWTSGVEGEFWWSEKAGIVVWKKGNEDLRAMREGHLSAQRFDKTSFSWVNESNYRGMKAVGKTQGQYYRMEVKDSWGEITVYQAWLDPATRRPLALQVGDAELGTFTFDLPLPEIPISISGDFAVLLDRCEKAMAPRKSYGR